MSIPRRTAAQPAILLLTRRPEHWEALRELLAAAGSRVRLCASLQAVGAARRRRSALLADLAHPELVAGGLGLLRAGQRPHALLVALSAGDGARDALDFEAARQAGACEFIASGEPAELSARRIQAALLRRSLERARESTLDAGQLAHLLRTACTRARRAKSGVAVLCFDLEFARQIAGGLSEACAEEWMCALGQRLRESCRSADQLARSALTRRVSDVQRTSRSEFLLVLRGPLDESALRSVAHRLSDVLRQPLCVAGEQVAATFHVGAVLWDGRSEPAELAEHARAAACWARQRGPCAVQLYATELKTRTLERLALESALRGAVERGEFLLHYQPRVAVDGLQTVALEALVRWRHPRLGLVPPAEFIPLAEETGLIVPLGAWVLEQACAQARRWQDEGFEPVRMAVNVSPLQFHDTQLLAGVKRVLATSGLDPRWLELELTESMLMQDSEHVVEALHSLKELGVSISIDDFGTGYSALAYLRRFPIDALKIDRSFLRGVTRDPDDASIATAIVLMAKCLRLRVVGEGVETPGQLAFLRIMKCDEAQGYHFARPLPAEEVTRFLVRGAEAGRDGASSAAAA